MAPARAGFAPCCCSCCWGCGWPRSAPSPNTVSAQWFETQNVQPSPQGCSNININKHANHCRGLHTSLHEAFSSVATTCHTPTIACKIGQESCHRSQKPVSLTTCELPWGRYQDKQLDLFFIVARDPPQQDGLPALPVPVPWVTLSQARCFPHPTLCRLLALLLHFLP